MKIIGSYAPAKALARSLFLGLVVLSGTSQSAENDDIGNCSRPIADARSRNMEDAAKNQLAVECIDLVASKDQASARLPMAQLRRGDLWSDIEDQKHRGSLCDARLSVAASAVSEQSTIADIAEWIELVVVPFRYVSAFIGRIGNEPDQDEWDWPQQTLQAERFHLWQLSPNRGVARFFKEEDFLSALVRLTETTDPRVTYELSRSYCVPS